MKQLELGFAKEVSKPGLKANSKDCLGCAFQPRNTISVCSYLHRAKLAWAKKIYTLDTTPYQTQFRLIPKCYNPGNANVKILFEEDSARD